MQVIMAAGKNALLTDGELLLRPYRPRDAEDVYLAVSESLADMYPWMPWAHRNYSAKETRRWLRTRPEEWEKGVAYEFAIVSAPEGPYLGGCGLNRFDYANRTANLGYWVRSSRTGRGVAAAAARLLAGWGFTELRLNRIEIVVATDNLRSRRVAEKLGARFEGVMRDRLCLYDQAHDAALYSLVAGDPNASRPPGTSPREQVK
jgi:ribosomal-protein-serine acetyltransferase